MLSALRPGWLQYPSLPSLCEVCRSWGRARVCADCVARFAPKLPRCGRCGLRLGLPLPACGDCLRDPPPFARTVCGVDYNFPWDHLVALFKFQAQVELAGVLAALLQPALRARPQNGIDIVVPVPLAGRRLATRGYNQAWELARHLAADQRLPTLADGLLRAVDTAQQAELGRSARRHNLRAAFMVNPLRRAALQGLRVALVDDVMTTGATVREASAALLRGGAAEVEVWAVARTPATPGHD